MSGHCSALAALFPGLSTHLTEGWVGSSLDALVIIKTTASVGNQILISWLSSPGPSHCINPLKPELNPICYLLALLAHHFLHVSRIRVKSLTFRRLMSYTYMEHPFLMFLDHTQRRSTVGRTPLDE